MDSRHLHYFLAIASHESMSEAAEALHVSQPALSTSLRDLEKELGATLFDRHGKRLVINDNGRYLAQRAQAALAILDEAKQSIRTNASTRARTVNCGMKIPLGNSGALLRGFYDRRPDITIRMGYPTSSQFDQQSVDVTLFGTSLKIDDPNVITLGREELLAILPPEHPLANKPDLKLADLARDPFIFTNPSTMRDASISMCEEAGFEPHITMETQLFSEALSMVEAGIGCCIGTEVTWLAHMPFQVVARRPTDVHRHRYLYARVREHEQPSAATMAFINYLQDYAEEMATALRAHEQEQHTSHRDAQQ